MEIFQNIRIRIGKILMTKKVSSSGRKKHYSDISMVKKIGIVWDATNSGEFSILSKFHQKMHERGIEVKILGYFPEKELPDQFTALRYLSIIRRNELNAYYIPVSQESKDFITGHYDVLIDINFKNVFPLEYVMRTSDAGFKVGLQEVSEQESPFDMMLDIKPPVNIERYLNEAIGYLEMINSEKNKTA